VRIALIAHTDAPWTPHYARFLAQRGHDVHVISFHPKPLAHGELHYVGARAGDGRLPAWLYLWRVPRIARLLRRLAPDVVLAPYFRSNGLVGALTRCAPLVVSTRGLDFDFALPFGLGDHVTRFVARRADRLHASSPELVELLAAIGVPAQRFEVFPLGTDARLFTPREGPRPAGPTRIVCTRKHEPLYDNDTVVRALARLRERGFAFEARFVGTGSSLPRSQALARAVGVGDRVAFVGEVAADEVPEQLRWADVYVSAATSDGASSSLFEAMSCGLWPVVTDVRANRDWLVHRAHGFLFPIGDAAACAEGLAFAAANPAIAAAAAQRNRTLVARELDRETNLARLEALLVQAARSAARSEP
jgi:glycosyltransferase involved in cell wall biosynthesis